MTPLFNGFLKAFIVQGFHTAFQLSGTVLSVSLFVGIAFLLNFIIRGNIRDSKKRLKIFKTPF